MLNERKFDKKHLVEGAHEREEHFTTPRI